MISKHLISLFVVCLLLAGGAGTISVQESGQEAPLDQQHDARTTTRTYRFSSPGITVHDNRTIVTLAEATSSVGQTGAPRLPVVSKTFRFPFGTHIDSVDITYGGMSEQQLSRPVEVVSAPQITSINVGKQPSAPVTYAANEPFPERPYTVTRGAGLVHGQRATIATVHMYPVQYRPGNIIATAGQATITLRYTAPAEPMQIADDYGLLVLAPADYAEALQPLVDYKNDHETPAMLTMLDDIPEAGEDQQESIKLYIKKALRANARMNCQQGNSSR